MNATSLSPYLPSTFHLPVIFLSILSPRNATITKPLASGKKSTTSSPKWDHSHGILFPLRRVQSTLLLNTINRSVGNENKLIQKRTFSTQ